MAETFLSQQAYDRLSAELEDLKTNGRPQISAEIEVARAHGDLRENAEYHAAKDDQGHNERKIRDIEDKLATAVIVDDQDMPEGMVRSPLKPGSVS